MARPSGRRNRHRAVVCVLTIRSEGDHLVYRALYGSSIDPVSPTHELQTVELDEIVGLLRILSDDLRNPG